jgi:DinB superfamily
MVKKLAARSQVRDGCCFAHSSRVNLWRRTEESFPEEARMSVSKILVGMTAATALFAADSAAVDRTKLLDHLSKSGDGFERSINGLTPEQWKFKPAPDVWSVAECAEHIVLTENLLRDMVAKKILAGPSTTDRTGRATDDEVVAMITNRTRKATAPEMLKPSGQFTDPVTALAKFHESRAKTLDLVKSDAEFRAHTAPHSALKKELDAQQWLLYLSGHTMRHTAQIHEVKADSGFPKK